jgi:UDP-glucose 4-epimerase/UDP-glucuronate decarboxylase
MGYSHVIPEFIARARERPDTFEMFGGDQYRSFCFATDAAQMTINVMENMEDQIVNIGNDIDVIKIIDLARMIFDEMDYEPVIKDRGAPRGSIDRRVPDLKKIKEEGCFEYSVGLIEGVGRTFAWYTR